MRPKEAIQVGAVSIRFLVDADDSGGSVTVFESLIPAGARVPAPHSHDAFEETIRSGRRLHLDDRGLGA